MRAVLVLTLVSCSSAPQNMEDEDEGDPVCAALPCEAELLHITPNPPAAYDILTVEGGALFWSAATTVQRYALSEGVETQIVTGTYRYQSPVVVGDTLYAIVNTGLVSVPAVGGEPTTLVSDPYIRDLAFADGYLFWANYDTLFQGDPFTGEVAVSVEIGFEPNALVIANQYAYVHHFYGQARYHHPSGDFAVFFPGKDYYETPLVANASGAIWSRGGIFYLRPHGSDQVQTLFALDKGRGVTALHADAGGFLWADDQKGVFRHDLALKETVRVTDTTFMSAYVAITSDVNTIYLMTATGDIAAVPRAGID